MRNSFQTDLGKRENGLVFKTWNKESRAPKMEMGAGLSSLLSSVILRDERCFFLKMALLVLLQMATSSYTYE